MTKRFERAYNALVKSFLNDTLISGNCDACAIGNIVSACKGGTIQRISSTDVKCDTNNHFWSQLFVTAEGFQSYYIFAPNKEQLEHELLSLTGYSGRELAGIEAAFERNTKFKVMDVGYSKLSPEAIAEDQYKGLCAVVELMMELDGIEGVDYKTAFKQNPVLQTA